jgi:hypothetical protein
VRFYGSVRLNSGIQPNSGGNGPVRTKLSDDVRIIGRSNGHIN